MRKLAVLMVAVVMVGSVWSDDKNETHKMPTPTKEHEWLKQLVGEWETDAEMVMAPDQPTVKSKGTEVTRSLGGFWTVSEYKCECMGTSMTGIMTVGFSPAKKKFVGTWVCSMCDWQCEYKGTVKDKVLTLECEGPSPVTGKLAKMKDVIELKSPDHKVMTSYIQLEDGKWVTFMTLNARRKK